MLVYQRVNLHFPMVFLWFSYGFPIFSPFSGTGSPHCHHLSLTAPSTARLETPRRSSSGRRASRSEASKRSKAKTDVRACHGSCTKVGTFKASKMGIDGRWWEGGKIWNFRRFFFGYIHFDAKSNRQYVWFQSGKVQLVDKRMRKEDLVRKIEDYFNQKLLDEWNVLSGRNVLSGKLVKIGDLTQPVEIERNLGIP